jgi:hypothetical protein
MSLKHLRTIALAGTFVLGTAGLGLAAGSGSGSGAGSGMGSGSSSTNLNSNSTNTGATRNSTGTTGLENAETRGSSTGQMEKKHGKAFQREDANTTEKNELNTKRK